LSQEVEKTESPSYPGLESHYERYQYEVYLPDNLYKPEYIESNENGMRTYLTWR
jgi:hypothetical protein